MILRTEVKVGDFVKKNQLLLVMEAMKMENEVFAPCDGVISEIKVAQGQQLNADDVLMVIGGTAASVAAPAPAAPAAPAPAAPAAPVAAPGPAAVPGGGTTVKAPLPGLILRTEVKVGDFVKKNQLLLCLGSMKMENEIFSPAMVR
jgi:pyruvate carboxylase subunit B